MFSPLGVRRARRSLQLCAMLLFWTAVVRAQDSSPGQAALFPPPKPPVADSLAEVRAQMQELKSMLTELRGEMARSREEAVSLRKELESTRQQMAALRGATPAALGASNLPQETKSAGLQEMNAAPLAAAPQAGNDRLSELEDQYRLLTGKVDEQYQSKVESASKYRVRLSGIVLTNVFSNSGSVDNQDVPTWAASNPAGSSGGSFGATLRQSELGLEVFGPQLAGARSRADVQFDFAGGFPPGEINGSTSGIVRLRIATARLDWTNTSIVAGQDGLFFSPLSPTSLASLAIPAFSYAGNLWTWTPQVRVEHRMELSTNSKLSLQAGLLDPLTGEAAAASFLRFPTAGENSRQPAYAGHVAWSRAVGQQSLSFGAGGYYSRQNWGFHRNVDSWAGTADWQIPLAARLDLTGEFYRGKAVGGLGGGIGNSVVMTGPVTDPNTQIRAINSTGGWTQLKFRATEKLEFNGGVGEDSPRGADIRGLPIVLTYSSLLQRNQSALVNFIFRPRSDLLFSTEYRHFRTLYAPRDLENAGQLNISLGVLF